MKKILVLIFISSFISGLLSAQTNIKIGSGSKMPVLIDDINTSNYKSFFTSLAVKNVSALKLVSALNNNQIKIIERIEKTYSYKWLKIQNKLNTELAELKSNSAMGNTIEVEKSQSKVRVLIISMLKLNYSYRCRIIEKLTLSQINEYNGVFSGL